MPPTSLFVKRSQPGTKAPSASVLGNHGRRINANVVMLADLDKKLLADSLHDTAKQSAFPFPELIESAQQQGRASDTVLMDGHPYQLVVVPVLAPMPARTTKRGDIQIAAVLQRPLKESLVPFNRLRETLVALALASIAFSVLGSVLIARGIAGPINRLAGVARKVRDGDYSQKAESGRSDEIGDFADSFNHMLEGIFERESKILRLAYEDTLTGLPNRAMFIDRLDQAIQGSRQNGEAVVVLMMDLNRFKPINDSLGHPVGDQVLQEVARRLQELLRTSETVARFGGDEFAVLLPLGGMHRARTVVNLIEQALATPIVTQGQPIDLSASIGIAVFPGYAGDTAALIRHADIAMYVAPSATTPVSLPTNRSSSGARQLSLLGELRSAVEQDQLALYYQPKVDLHSGASDSVEALVRWAHPLRGFV